MTIEIKSFWREDDATLKDVQFADALAFGLIRFGKFVEAKKINLAGIRPRSLRKHVQNIMRKSS
jgi:hypothetical protein